MDHEDGEFRGSTKQAIQDLTHRFDGMAGKFDRFEDKISANLMEMAARFEGKIDALAKRTSDQEERYNAKFAHITSFNAMDDEIKELRMDVNRNYSKIEALEQWRVYIIGIMTVLMALLTFFGNELRRLIFRG